MTGLEAFETVYNNVDYLISDIVIENDEVNDCLMTIKEQLPTIKQALKALEIIKEKNVNMFGFKRDIKQLGNRFTYKYYQSNLGNYHSGFNIQELTEEEFNLLKEVLE